MIIALTREPARSLDACELTYREREPIDAGVAAEQHRAYREALSACGAEVITLPPIDELPDSVFVEDTAIVLDELVVLTRPGVESRRAEVEIIEPAVARLRPVARVEPPATLEGGDVMRAGRKLYVGLSPRTNAAGVAALGALAAPHGYEVVPVALRDCLHLKTGCSTTRRYFSTRTGLTPCLSAASASSPLTTTSLGPRTFCVWDTRCAWARPSRARPASSRRAATVCAPLTARSSRRRRAR